MALGTEKGDRKGGQAGRSKNTVTQFNFKFRESIFVLMIHRSTLLESYIPIMIRRMVFYNSQAHQKGQPQSQF